ncbi:MAG: neutral/alkaline non-lysosomal ceramidase N-terminal domain-containing protein [Clostridium sp.]|uniref:neutral/alkaline non-lysosomal ceramidase N-terminal domain-containing protein n=1 Tax=Clostridium sp. TaxID=1506 RepID=UPI0039E970C5
MKVGSAQINITPEMPFFLAGSALLRVSKTVLDPLMASCMVVDNGSEIVAFISCDLINLKDEVVEDVRSRIHKETGIKYNNIILSATHTHQGPKTGLNMPAPWIKLDQRIVETLVDKIVRSAVTANKNKKEARIGYDKGCVNKCNFNRRYIMSNGRSQFATRGFNPERLVPEGPVDNEIQVVWFEDLKGRYITVAVNFSCHPTVLFNTEYVSADFPGSMRSVIQAVIGKDVPVLYLQGACGNLNTVDIEDESTKCQGRDGLERIGRILGGEVLKLISQNSVSEEDYINIQVKNRIVNIPLRKISDEDIKEAEKKWGQFTDQDKVNIKKFNETYHTFSTIELGRQIKINPNCPVEISVICLGDIVIVTNPVELFVEYQLELKYHYKGKKIIVVELTNGHAGYVPTKLAFALRGYEMQRAISSKLNQEAGRIIVDTSTQLINEIYT